MSDRIVWHSRDGGKSWHGCIATPGSVIANIALSPTVPWTDGFGNSYLSAPPGAIDTEANERRENNQ